MQIAYDTAPVSRSLPLSLSLYLCISISLPLCMCIRVCVYNITVCVYCTCIGISLFVYSLFSLVVFPHPVEVDPDFHGPRWKPATSWATMAARTLSLHLLCYVCLLYVIVFLRERATKLSCLRTAAEGSATLCPFIFWAGLQATRGSRRGWRIIPASVNKNTPGEQDPWEHSLEHHQIGGCKAASAAGFHGQGSSKRSDLFTGTGSRKLAEGAGQRGSALSSPTS